MNIKNIKLECYGLVIRGDENTSEDQVASVFSDEFGRLLVHRFNNYERVVTENEKLKKGSGMSEYEIEMLKLKLVGLTQNQTMIAIMSAANASVVGVGSAAEASLEAYELGINSATEKLKGFK